MRGEEGRWDVDRLIRDRAYRQSAGGIYAAFFSDSASDAPCHRGRGQVAQDRFLGMSSDANVAMSLGVPAVTIGGGGKGGNWHSLNEWYENKDAYLGPQHALLLLLVLAGLEGVSDPMLTARQTP